MNKFSIEFRPMAGYTCITKDFGEILANPLVGPLHKYQLLELSKILKMQYVMHCK